MVVDYLRYLIVCAKIKYKLKIEMTCLVNSDLIFDRRFGIICMEFILSMDEYWNVLQPNLKPFMPPLTNQFFKKQNHDQDDF